ncbi:MAG: ABC transporter permease, partial [Saprospiraceae bacterium]
MAHNQIKITWRNLFKYPVYSFINLTGLSIGIAASFILLLYVQQEWSYERHIPGFERVYRVATDFFDMGGFASSQPILHYYLSTEAQEVESATAVDRAYQALPVRVNERDYQENGIFYIDSSFFRVFALPLKFGKTDGQLATDEVIISEAIAEKYFGATEAIGQIIAIDKAQKPYKVVAVLEKQIQKSHIQPHFLLPRAYKNEPNWTSAAIYNYVKLKPGKTETDLKKYLDQLLRTHIHPAVGGNLTFEQWYNGNSAVKFFIQPLQDIYLHSNYKFEIAAGGNPTQIRVLGIIALFIILIAVINYVNLSTARSSIRAKEVGIKKTLGVHRKTLIRQFLLESVLFSLLAMGIAMIFSEGLLLVFERITENKLTNSLFDHWQYPAALLGFSLLTGLLAGTYPAFYLTAFNANKVLKGDLTLGGNKTLRSSLVVVQFSIAIILIISSIIVYQQLQFLQYSDKGLTPEGVLIIENAGDLKEKASAFKQTIEQQAQVISTSYNNRMPAGSS